MRRHQVCDLDPVGFATDQRGQILRQIVLADDSCSAVHPAIAWAHRFGSTYAKLGINRVILPRPAACPGPTVDRDDRTNTLNPGRRAAAAVRRGGPTRADRPRRPSAR